MKNWGENLPKMGWFQHCVRCKTITDYTIHDTSVHFTDYSIEYYIYLCKPCQTKKNIEYYKVIYKEYRNVNDLSTRIRPPPVPSHRVYPLIPPESLQDLVHKSEIVDRPYV